jgi:hypothetical protein
VYELACNRRPRHAAGVDGARHAPRAIGLVGEDLGHPQRLRGGLVRDQVRERPADINRDSRSLPSWRHQLGEASSRSASSISALPYSRVNSGSIEQTM